MASRKRHAGVCAAGSAEWGTLVDVLVRPEVLFGRLMVNAVAGELFGRHVPIASIDDLLTMKRVANRPKDLLDMSALAVADAKEMGSDANSLGTELLR